MRKAVAALVKHLSNEAAKKKNQLLEEDEVFHLVRLNIYPRNLP